MQVERPEESPRSIFFIASTCFWKSKIEAGPVKDCLRAGLNGSSGLEGRSEVFEVYQIIEVPNWTSIAAWKYVTNQFSWWWSQIKRRKRHAYYPCSRRGVQTSFSISSSTKEVKHKRVVTKPSKSTPNTMFQDISNDANKNGDESSANPTQSAAVGPASADYSNRDEKGLSADEMTGKSIYGHHK